LPARHRPWRSRLAHFHRRDLLLFLKPVVTWMPASHGPTRPCLHGAKQSAIPRRWIAPHSLRVEREGVATVQRRNSWRAWMYRPDPRVPHRQWGNYRCRRFLEKACERTSRRDRPWSQQPSLFRAVSQPSIVRKRWPQSCSAPVSAPIPAWPERTRTARSAWTPGLDCRSHRALRWARMRLRQGLEPVGPVATQWMRALACER
jgi:hypothetical protein